MGFFSWLGFGKPRDAPTGEKTERTGLPEITDNVRDSGQTFFFGTASSGERVDEKSAMQISTVYACVRLLAETVAGLPLHLYRYTGNGDAKEKALDHPLYKILYRKPNPEMTSFTFRETMMTHLLLWGNAYGVSYQQVRSWTLKYKELGEAGLEDRRGKRKYEQEPRTELEKAQIEIAQLKHQLQMAQWENRLLKKLEEIERSDALDK